MGLVGALLAGVISPLLRLGTTNEGLSLGTFLLDALILLANVDFFVTVPTRWTGRNSPHAGS